MHSLGEKLKAHWSRQGLTPRLGVPGHTLKRFEDHYRVRLPLDLRSYFAAVDGSGNDEMDGNYFRFWTLNELDRVGWDDSPERLLRRLTSYFSFADHSIALPTFAIRLAAEPDDDNHVLAVFGDGDGRAYRVAESFTEFVEKYLADERSRMDLLHGPEI